MAKFIFILQAYQACFRSLMAILYPITYNFISSTSFYTLSHIKKESASIIELLVSKSRNGFVIILLLYISLHLYLLLLSVWGLTYLMFSLNYRYTLLLHLYILLPINTHLYHLYHFLHAFLYI